MDTELKLALTFAGGILLMILAFGLMAISF
ncbi:YnhF family membrane protein [Thaumasiovibrio subtropicus]|nr:YnhF family membrane protein [Thaumasiovibrio subtropicus]